MAHSPNDGNAMASPTTRTRSIAEFASGAAFGAALLGAGVYAPAVIKSQMNFTSNTMITVMMGGSAASAIIQDIGDRYKLLPKTYPPPPEIGLFPYDANLIGGALIGFGMGLTGSCPGTALAQAGTGMQSGFIVLASGVAGALAYLQFQPVVNDLRQRRQTTPDGTLNTTPESPDRGTKARDIASALGLPPLALLLIWVPLCLAVMSLAFAKDTTVRDIPASGLVRPIYGGLLIGIAQLVTTAVAGHTIGASGAYEDAARWVTAQAQRCSKKQLPNAKVTFLTPSVVFSGGVLVAAAGFSHLVPKIGAADASSGGLIDYKDALQAVVGGVAMGFGSRLARGCTSGHGISGLARFSIPSLVSTAALFSGGIITVLLLG